MGIYIAEIVTHPAASSDKHEVKSHRGTRDAEVFVPGVSLETAWTHLSETYGGPG